jgi:hypothetical protein
MERRASPPGHPKFVIEENPVILSEAKELCILLAPKECIAPSLRSG